MSFFYSLGIVLMILFEVCIAISLNEDHFGTKIKRKREFFGVATTNAVCLMLGLLPLSVPVSKVKFALQSGADHKVFHLFSFLMMIFLYFFCFDLVGYIPLCFMKALNFLMSLILIEPKTILTYKAYSNRLFYSILAIILTMLMLDLTWCIVLFLAAYFGTYFLKVKDEELVYSSKDDGFTEIRLRGRFPFRKVKQALKYCKDNNVTKLSVNFEDVIESEINYLRNYRDGLKSL